MTYRDFNELKLLPGRNQRMKDAMKDGMKEGRKEGLQGLQGMTE